MPERMADLAPENISTLDRLVRSIDLAEGFALFIARCNVPVLRNDLVLTARQQLAALGVEVVEVAFADEPLNVRQRLVTALVAADEDTEAPILVELPAPRQPLLVAEPPAGYIVGGKRAVFVTGLELGIPYDQPNARVLAELNLGRDAFPRDVPHPLVIWLPDYAVTAVARFAPDFWAWRSGVFEFETGKAERSATFEQFTADRSWRTLTNLTPDARLLRRRQLESLLDDYRDLLDEPRVIDERAQILADLGQVCAAAQEFRAALIYYTQALPIQRQVGDLDGEATTLNDIGGIYAALGDKRLALNFFEQALPLTQQVGDQGGEATTLNNLGAVYDDLGDKRQALACYEQALPLRRQVGDRGGEATTLNNLGAVYDNLGDKRQALAYYEQALPLSRQVGDRGGEAATLNNIGEVYAALGEHRRALDCHEQALPLRQQVGDRGGEATTLNNIGLAYSALGDKRKALDYYEQAVNILHQIGDRWHESMGRANLARVHAALGDLAKAEEQLALVIALDEAVGHPDLASHRAALEWVHCGADSGHSAPELERLTPAGGR